MSRLALIRPLSVHARLRNARSLGLLLGVSAGALGTGLVFAEEKSKKSIYDPKEPEYEVVEASTVLEVFIRNSRHTASKYLESTNSFIKSTVDSVIKVEQDTVAAVRSLVSDGEDFVPGSLYVATATFGTVVLVRRSNVVVRWIAPLLALDAALLYFYPNTSDKFMRKVLTGTPYLDTWENVNKTTRDAVNNATETIRSTITSSSVKLNVFMHDALDISKSGLDVASEAVDNGRKRLKQVVQGTPVDVKKEEGGKKE